MTSHPCFDISGSTALITGTSRGIGRALALGFAAAGARVAGCSRQASGAERTAREIRNAGGDAFAMAADLTEEQDVHALFKATQQHFATPDIVVANAGIDITKPALEFTAAQFDTVIRTNLRATFSTVQAAARAMIAEGIAGSIIMVSSNAAQAAFAELGPYCASKAGVDGLVRALANEWGPHGIRVNAINPGYTTHQMNPQSETIMRKAKADIIARTPLRRIAEPEEMVGPALFLASPAAAYVTGLSLVVDGGWCAV